MELFSKDLAVNIIGGLLASFIIFAGIQLRNKIYKLFYTIYFFIIVLISHRRLILIWNDEEIAISHKIVKHLGKYFSNKKFKIIDSPKKILNLPLNPIIVEAVILLVMDVTKLSDKKNLRNKIQRKLNKFIHSGGGIIGSHDIIYRRVRNEILEKAFGCQGDNFRREEQGVLYTRNMDKGKEVFFEGLPDNFLLYDNEILWGNWSPDVSVIFCTSNNENIPLVVAREYSHGKVVWINSGDRTTCPPMSILKPQDEFILLLRNSINWICDKS